MNISSLIPVFYVVEAVVVVVGDTTSGTYIIAFSYADAAKGSLGIYVIN